MLTSRDVFRIGKGMTQDQRDMIDFDEILHATSDYHNDVEEARGVLKQLTADTTFMNTWVDDRSTMDLRFKAQDLQSQAARLLCLRVRIETKETLVTILQRRLPKAAE